MNLIKTISFFLIFTSLINAQNISRWKNHSSMRDTKDITIFNNTHLYKTRSYNQCIKIFSQTDISIINKPIINRLSLNN